jgi:hypothetical protein
MSTMLIGGGMEREREVHMTWGQREREVEKTGESKRLYRTQLIEMHMLEERQGSKKSHRPK